MPGAFTNEADLSWQRCISVLRSTVDETSFKTWISPVQVQNLDVKSGQPILKLTFPNQFHRDWVVDKYGDQLERAAKKVLGEGTTLQYKCAGYMLDNKKPIEIPPVSEAKLVEKPKKVVQDNKKKGNTLGLNPSYGFANLVEGESNKTAARASKDIARYPGDRELHFGEQNCCLNPLCVLRAVCFFVHLVCKERQDGQLYEILSRS